MNFLDTATKTDEATLVPARDSNVLACQAACAAAQDALTSAKQAFTNYIILHGDGSGAVPYARPKQRLHHEWQDAQAAATEAEAAYTVALDTATEKATALWDARIRRAFRDDLPVIEQFIAVLERHDALRLEAETAGVTRALNVPSLFFMATNMRTIVTNTTTALGLED